MVAPKRLEATMGRQYPDAKTQEEVACASGGAEEARGEELVGTRIAVWWEDDSTWYNGVVVAAAPCTACGDPVYHHAAGHSHHILYDDNAEQWETLDKLGKGWRLLAPAPAPAHGGIHSVRPGAPPAPPAPPAPSTGGHCAAMILSCSCCFCFCNSSLCISLATLRCSVNAARASWALVTASLALASATFFLLCTSRKCCTCRALDSAFSKCSKTSSPDGP